MVQSSLGILKLSLHGQNVVIWDQMASALEQSEEVYRVQLWLRRFEPLSSTQVVIAERLLLTASPHFVHRLLVEAAEVRDVLY